MRSFITGSLQQSRPVTARATASDAILTFTEDGCIEAANPAAEGLLFYSPNELLGRRIFSLIPRDCEVMFITAMQTRTEEAHVADLGCLRPFRLLRKDGNSVAVQARIASVRLGNRLLWTLLAQDNTSYDRAATQWQRMERLAAIGEAVTGIVHESRNSLQRIGAAVHQLKRVSAEPKKLVEFIARIENATDDLQRLHETVVEFVRPRILQPGLTDIRDVVHAAWKAVAARLNDSAELQEQHRDADTHCEVDAFALRQVFRNIFENSLAACSDSTRVDVFYKEVEVSDEAGLRVAIRDNGPGLSDEQRQMVFEPFYTTKEHGLGLGMTIAKQIIEAHGGEIFLGTGAGTEIVIVLRKVLR